MHGRIVSSAVADAAEAFAVDDLYRRRWAIEPLFRSLKTQGFDIEAVRIGEDVPRSKLTMAALVSASPSRRSSTPARAAPAKAASGRSPTPRA